MTMFGSTAIVNATRQKEWGVENSQGMEFSH